MSMDLLSAAVVDITTLVATCHALKSSPAEGVLVLQHKLRNRLHRDLGQVPAALSTPTVGRVGQGEAALASQSRLRRSVQLQRIDDTCPAGAAGRRLSSEPSSEPPENGNQARHGAAPACGCRRGRQRFGATSRFCVAHSSTKKIRVHQRAH